MEEAEMTASSQTSGQEKWRKLFMQMRIKLKPHDIGIRCRIFEGVVSGEDVAAWLMRTAGSQESSSNFARDRSEACAIGQELLICGLLMNVSAGFAGNDEEEKGDEIASAVKNNPIVTKNTVPSFDPTSSCGDYNPTIFSRFSVMPAYIYRFPGKSGTAGSWSLFGAHVAIKIPTMCLFEENENIKPSRDTVGFLVSNNAVFAEDIQVSAAGGDEISGEGVVNSIATSTTSASFVKYFIDVTHGNENTWQIFRRYKEFEQLHKMLLKEGIKPDATVSAPMATNLVRSEPRTGVFLYHSGGGS
jgi:hypothetical protein